MTRSGLSTDQEERLRRALFSYPEVGATRGALPAGYTHLRVGGEVGRGQADFFRAADALFGWQAQRRAGVRVAASASPVEPDTVAVLRLGVGPLAVAAPVRVVYVVEEPRRSGFAYGTLPGHPEAGEESFTVVWGEDDRVGFEVTAFSNPASRLTRLGGPAARGVQRLVAERYVRALRRCVRTGAPR